YKEYKNNMQFQQCHITDIHHNMKQDSLTSVFTKYKKNTNVKMQTQGM
ncbi:1108_t:CDS:1, partial [Funneliformis geosporum]